MLAGVAEFERGLIVEQTVAGIDAARKRGVLARRPCVFRRDEVQRLPSEGKPWKTISTTLGVPVETCRDAI